MIAFFDIGPAYQPSADTAGRAPYSANTGAHLAGITWQSASTQGLPGTYDSPLYADLRARQSLELLCSLWARAGPISKKVKKIVPPSVTN